jgi:hypothetical protein
MTNTTPILAIDIDGPLNPRAHTNAQRKNLRARGFRLIEWRKQVRYVPGSKWLPYTDLWLNPVHGAMLAKFSRDHDVELVWASLWEHNANTIVGPVLGLPRLPFVDFHGHQDGPAFWKYRALADYAKGRPLAWLDDSFTHKHRQAELSGWSKLRRNVPTLLQEVNASVGVTAQDLDIIAAWLKTTRLAWPNMEPTYELPKPPVWKRGSRRRSTRRHFASADIEHSSMSDEAFIDALALDGSPPF